MVMGSSSDFSQVMRAHPDFAGDANPPNDLDPTPSFKIVQDTTKRYVLILDVSKSMNEQNRMTILNQVSDVILSQSTPATSLPYTRPKESLLFKIILYD